jgi:hypothetical protein
VKPSTANAVLPKSRELGAIKPITLFEFLREKPSTLAPLTFWEVMVIPAWAISKAEYALLIIEILLMLTEFFQY